MPRRTEDYSIIERSGSPYWYYRVAGMTAYKSTGLLVKGTRRKDAEAWARAQYERASLGPEMPLVRWATSFFGSDCPRCSRLAEEGRPVTDGYRADCRHIVETDILTDELAGKAMGQIRKDDILAFRTRVVNRRGPTRIAQRVMSTLAVIFAEAELRELVERNPCHGIGKISAPARVSGIFSREEMVALFGSAPGQWGSIEAYTCFFLAAGTGLRRNEILALRWSDVSSSILRVESQFVRYSDKRSAPKSKRGRLTEIPHRVEEALEAWHKLTKFPEPESLIFCGPDGLRRGATWWLKAFRRAMSALKIDYTVRNLKPHSFRHTLVSRLRSSGGVSDKAIRDAIGHGTEAIQDRYTHQDEDSVRGIGKAVDEII